MPSVSKTLAVYETGEEIEKFRFYAEQAYVTPAEYSEEETPGKARSLSGASDALHRLTRLVQDIPENIGGRLGHGRAGEALVVAGKERLKALTSSWGTPEHRSRIAAFRRMSDRKDDEVRTRLTMLTGSPVGPERWGRFEAAARQFVLGVPGDYQPLFELGRVLGRVPYPTSDDSITMGNDSGGDQLDKWLASRIKVALGWAASVVPPLEGLWPRRTGYLRDQLFDLRTAVIEQLRHETDLGVASARPSKLPPSEYHSLLELKIRIDKDYIGESSAILRVFEQIEICRTAGFRCVLLLGPKGTGKTTLAEIIHRVLASEKDSSKFLRWQASQSQAADALGPRSQWVGFAPNTGYPNVPEKGQAGYLEQYAGGTIFVDEFGDLHPDVQTLLLDVAEGRDQLRVGSTQKPFKPRVNLIFATNKNVREVIRDDLLARIGTVINLPPLRERKEDLFPLIRHFLSGTRFKLSMRTWSLFLRHDWPENVRELEMILNRVRATYRVRHGELKEESKVKTVKSTHELSLETESLGHTVYRIGDPTSKKDESKVKKVELPHELFLETESLRHTANRIGDPSNEKDAEALLFKELRETLERRGYTAKARGKNSQPLYDRMAQLLGWHKSRVARVKARLERKGS